MAKYTVEQLEQLKVKALGVIEDLPELGLAKALEKNNITLNAFFNQLQRYPAIDERYLRSRMVRAEKLVEETVQISDEEDDPHKARIRVETRRWYASKITPKIYGDRIDLNVTQTIDIGSALTEARNRVLSPRLPELAPQRQVIDLTHDVITSTSDAQSIEDLY